MASLLSRLFTTPSSAAAFGGVERLLNEARKFKPELTRNQVQNWLASQTVYQLHKPVRHNFKRDKIVVSRLNELWEADLVDLNRIAQANDNYKYILTVIDVFSKQLHVRALKSKTGIAVRDALKEIFATVHPEILRSDRGREFKNTEVAHLLKKHCVQQRFALNEKTKAPIVERVNRTLKERMFKLFTHRGQQRYVDELQNLVDGYNASYHRTIKMCPKDVVPINATTVFRNTYGVANRAELAIKRLSRKRSKQLQVGTNVRIKKPFKPLQKGYQPRWYKSVRKVTHSSSGIPFYKVDGSSGDALLKRYYKQELQASPEIEYEQVRILERSGNQVFIKWLQQPGQPSNWIDAADLERD